MTSDSASQRRLSTCSLENMTTDDYTNLHPQVLGQLFDKILDYLQNDFDDLVGKLKEQVSTMPRGGVHVAHCFCVARPQHETFLPIFCTATMNGDFFLMQNVHLKQDVISLRKKLQDAVETNDEQVG